MAIKTTGLGRCRRSAGETFTELKKNVKQTFRHLCQKVTYELNSLLGRLLSNDW
jgi:hypothetical protein